MTLQTDIERLKRFEPHSYSGAQAPMVPTTEGRWLRHEDVLRAVNEYSTAARAAFMQTRVAEDCSAEQAGKKEP